MSSPLDDLGLEGSQGSAPTRRELRQAQGEPDAAPAPTSKKKRRRMKPAVKWTLWGLLAVLLIAVGAVAVYVWSLWNSYDSQVEVLENVFQTDDLRPEPLTGEAANAQTILLLGTDSRSQIEDLDDLRGTRSDTMMVVHIPATRDEIIVMSIMRDNWVTIPGRGEHKINAAMAFGGVPLVVQTVEEFIGARIDHVAVIDFEGFKGVTEALGGVTVNNPRAFTSHHSKVRFESGEIVLQGEPALDFVRERYAFPDGDYTRARNQQLFMKGVLSKVLSAETLTNPGKISGVVSEIAPYLQVDSGLDIGYLASLGLEMRHVRASDVTFFTSPTLGTGMVGDQSIVWVDWDELEKIRAAIRAGTLGDYEPTGR